MENWKSCKMKYIICDGDQTIYENVKTPVDNSMLATIQNLIDKGYGFGVISGTSVNSLAKLVRSGEIEREHHLLGNSGAAYYTCNGNGLEEIYEEKLKLLDRELIKDALVKLIENYDINPLTNREDQLQDRGSQITLSALGRNAPIKLKEKYDPNGKKRMEYITFLRNFLPEDLYNIKIGGTTSIDITMAKIDKGWGISRFAECNASKLEDIIFFGDKLMPGGNDHSVVKLDGVKCISVKNVRDTLGKLNLILHSS